MATSTEGSDSMNVKSRYLVLLVLVSIGGLYWLISRAIADGRNDRILRSVATTILYEAKHNPPEHGEYVLDDVCKDYWGSPVTAVLLVEQYANNVKLRSPGRDKIKNGNDFYYSDTDIHVRKLLKSGVQETGKSWGKGLAQGVMEGIQEESAEKVAATKKKASELLSRFRKVEEEENDE